MPKIGNFVYPWGNGHYSRMMRLHSEMILAVDKAQMHYISKPPIYEKLYFMRASRTAYSAARSAR